MKNIKQLFILGLILTAFSAAAQDQKSMRLNEVLVVNTSDFQDDFGQHSPWIELFNTSYGTVDIGGCYLSDDPSNLTKYMIPKGDVTTKIKPRQHALFWADGQTFRGTFHTSFVLNEGKEILFVGSDGKTIIDRVTIPTGILTDNVSYARTQDGNGEWAVAGHTSPSTNNSNTDGESKSQKMARIDPHGFILALTAMSVVFSALIILYLIFKFIGKASMRSNAKKSVASGNVTVEKAKDNATTSGETFAAIAMALHMFREENESHDEESFVVTLKHTDRSYSPWSSKIYSLRETPQIRKK